MNRAENLARQLASDHSQAPANVCAWHIIGILGVVLVVALICWLTSKKGEE